MVGFRRSCGTIADSTTAKKPRTLVIIVYDVSRCPRNNPAVLFQVIEIRLTYKISRRAPDGQLRDLQLYDSLRCVTEDDLRFCNDKCHEKGFLVRVANQVPTELLVETAAEVHRGPCPVCGDAAVVDVHKVHKIWSILILTSWNSEQIVCCRSCGVKKQLGALAGASLVGWWGFPWGLIMTPVQIVRNLKGLISPPSEAQPSDDLIQVSRFILAASVFEDQAVAPGASSPKSPAGTAATSHQSTLQDFGDPVVVEPTAEPLRPR